ncbi:MAG: hypothetical protein KJO41_10745 [Bacteroidia bacterium]|nr:hypothetical protein [Bacteroidia bacterium]MBT8279471.1 hypothetical protein [Bacteroidia bacterium]NND24943.1 hypothetical protein [Flavobacteriaceae bacterium]NNK61296.1 hypothetical protein [Flavobacteriaceae bacterium]NNL31739.1 hypothetical protein [Flavobacteriaceae bacterium]
MKILKYILLSLLLWGASSFSLVAFGQSVGSNVSYLTYILLLLYYFFSKKRRFLLPMILLGLSYFIISGFIYVDDSEEYIYEFIKYLIIVICGAELARNTTRKEFSYFLLIGAMSIIIHSVVYADAYGRYSGFYLNPNGAAFVCLIGYCLTFGISNKAVKYFLIFTFTFAGVLTFSRFFFLMWLIITLISIASDKKNIQLLGIGFATLAILISAAAILQVNTERFSILLEIIDYNLQTSKLTEDTRLESWAKYYEDILANPIFGNGFKSFSGMVNVKQGVHNTFLMVIGEAGLIPFFIILGFYFYMLKLTFKVYKEEMYKFLIAVLLIAILMVMHNYFNNEIILFVTIWLYVRLDNRAIQVELTSQKF